MSKIKKTLITASVFLVIGVSGTIATGINMVPKIANEVHRVEKEISSTTPMEREIFSTTENVANLDIVSLEKSNINVEIRKSQVNALNVKVYEYVSDDMEVKANYDRKTGTVYVEGYKKKFDIFKQNSLKEGLTKIYNKIIYTMAEEKNNVSELVIEVPYNVDINFNSEYHGNLVISDSSVLKDNIAFKSIGGELELPANNTLKNIDINTQGFIRLDVNSFINAQNVNINGNDVDIVTKGKNSSYEEKAAALPDVVTITGNEVSIDSCIPIGDEVNISAADVSYESNFKKYSLHCKFSGLNFASGEFKPNSLKDYNGKVNFDKYYNGLLGVNEKTNYYLNISDYNKCEIENEN